MANGREEVEVGMALDGASLGKMFADLDKRLANIKRQVDQIGKAAFEAGNKFDQGLISSLNKLNKVQGVVTKFEKNQTAVQRAPVAAAIDNQQYGRRVRQVSEYSKSLKDAASHADMLDIRMNRLIQTAAKTGEMTQHQRRRIAQLEEERGLVNRLERQYQGLNDKMRQGNIDGAAYFSRVQRARQNVTSALSQPGRTQYTAELNELKDAQAALDKYLRGVERMRAANPPGPPKLFGATGLKGVFARTAAYGGAAMLQFGALNLTAESLGFVKDFEAELKQLQAIAGATNTQMLQMRDAIISIGKETKFSLIELSKTAQILAQAGISSGKMPGVLKSVTNLAVASGSTTDESAQLVTSALGAFQLQGREAARVADLMTEALNRTKLTVQQTALAIQYVGATAYEQNISLENMLATVAAVAQAGVRSGSTIGTGFRQFLVDLETPSEKMLTTLEKYKLTAKDVDVQTRGLRAVIETLKSSGIGAADAYTIMETRAAAFYLIAKNNLDIIDQLQIAFTNQDAAIRANAVAMDSVAAQWSRLKNIMSAQLFSSMHEPLIILKNLFKQLGDFIDYSSKRTEEFLKRSERLSRTGSPLEKFLNTDLQPMLTNMLESALNGPKLPGMAAGGFGTWLRNLSEDTSDLSGKQEILATKLAQTSEAVEEKRGKIDALNKELVRLYTQSESISKSESRTDAETSTLTSRFEGLAKFVENTTDKFKALTDALHKLRTEESELLSGQYLEQSAAFHEQRANEISNFTELQRRLLKSLGPDYLAKQGVSQQAIGALAQPGRTQSQQIISAGILTDAALKIQDSNADLSKQLRDAANALRGIITAGVQERLSKNQAMVERYKGVPMGAQYESILTKTEGKLATMNALEEAQRKSIGKVLLSAVDQLLASIATKMSTATPEQMIYLKDVKSRAEETKRAIEGAMAANAAEQKAAKKAAQEREKDARKVKREDIDAIGKRFGLQLGSGYRSQEEQDRLRRLGYTKAVRSQHTYELARDFPTPSMSFADMKRLAARMQAEADATLGKGAIRFIAESPKDNGMGSGKHIHGQASKEHVVAKNTQLEEDPLTEIKSDMATKKLSMGTAERQLAEKLKKLKGGVTEELFFQLGAEAQDNIETWANLMRETAKDQAAVENLDDAETAARLQEVEDQIQQKFAELADVLFDAFIESIKKQVDDAKTKLENGMQMFEQNAAVAAAVSNGFGYQSNLYRTPDFVQQLAQRRANLASEARDRARSNMLPGTINDIEGQIGRLEGVSGNLTDPVKLEEAKTMIRDLKLEVAGLRSEKEQLDAALGAGGLIPTTFSEGIKQAIDAYREAAGLTLDFKQTVLMNITDGLKTAQEGLTQFFTDIISGTKSASQAFADFARSIMNWLVQLVAKFIASKIFEFLLSAFSPGSSGGGGGSITPKFHGGLISAFNGRYITKGVPGRDSTLVHGAKGEFMLRKAAVDSLGVDFVRDMNERGRHAVKPGAIAIPTPTVSETNVYVVKENEKPQMGPKDVLVVVHDDILNGGQTKRLIKHISHGG